MNYNDDIKENSWKVIEGVEGFPDIVDTKNDTPIVSNEGFFSNLEDDWVNAQLAATAPDLYDALKDVHKLIVEGAEHGFNPNENQWAERLFLSQQKTSRALKKATIKILNNN